MALPMRWVGIGAVILIPCAFLDGVDRFVQLPQVLVLHGVAIAALVAWLWRPLWHCSLLIAPLSAFLLAEAISAFGAQNMTASLLPISTHLAGVALAISLINGLSRRDFSVILMVACAVSGMLSLLGILQFLEVGADWVPSSGLPSATFGHRNLAATYIVGMIPLTGWLWWQAKIRRVQLLWAVVIGVEIAFLLATRSRGAWVGLVGSLLVFMTLAFVCRRFKWSDFIGRKSRWVQLGLAMILAVGIAGIPASISKGAGEAMWEGKQDLGTAVASVVRSGGDKGRLVLWRCSLAMIADYPVFGVGAGNWRLMFPVYAQGDMMDPRSVPYRPHNDPLWIWSETGTVGFLIYGWLLSIVGWLGWRVGAQDSLGWALLCGVWAVVICSLFGFPRAFPGAWLPFYLGVVGIGVVAKAQGEQDRSGLRVAILGVLVVVGVSGWSVLKQLNFDRQMLAVRIAFAQEKWPEVQRTATAALRYGTFNEDVLLMRGRAFVAQGHLDRALRDFEDGLIYHPHSVGLWTAKGNALRMGKNQAGAFEAFQQALVFDPRSGEVQNNIGMLYADAGHYDSARVAFEQALQYEPGLTGAYANLSIVFRREGELIRALDAAQIGLGYDPDHLELLVAQGNALMMAGHFDRAVVTFEKARQSHPERVEILFSLGQAYEKKGDIQRAIIVYERFLEAWKGKPVPQVNLARERLIFLKLRRSGG